MLEAVVPKRKEVECEEGDEFVAAVEETRVVVKVVVH